MNQNTDTKTGPAHRSLAKIRINGGKKRYPIVLHETQRARQVRVRRVRRRRYELLHELHKTGVLQAPRQAALNRELNRLAALIRRIVDACPGKLFLRA